MYMYAEESMAGRVAGESASLIDFMSGFSVETTPASAARIADFRPFIRPRTVVYITLLPGTD